MDAFRNFNQLGVSGIDEAKQAANEKLDALTNIHTRADQIVKAAAKMKLFAGAQGLGGKVSKFMNRAGGETDDSLVEKGMQAVASKAQEVGSQISSFVKDPLGVGADPWATGGAEEGFIAKGGSALTKVGSTVGGAEEGEAVLDPVTMQVVEKGTETAARVASTVGSDAAKAAEMAAKKAAALAAEVGEGGVVADAIPFGDIASIAIGGITALIAAHKAKVATHLQQAETSPAITTNESFQAGIGTDE